MYASYQTFLQTPFMVIFSRSAPSKSSLTSFTISSFEGGDFLAFLLSGSSSDESSESSFFADKIKHENQHKLKQLTSLRYWIVYILSNHISWKEVKKPNKQPEGFRVQTHHFFKQQENASNGFSQVVKSLPLAFLVFLPGDIFIETTFLSFFAGFLLSFPSFLGDFGFFAEG